MQTKKRLHVAVVILLTAGIVGVAFGAPPRVFNVDREFYPYYPSLVKWNKSDAHYGITVPAVVKKLNVEAKLRFRQADQKVAEKLLAAVPKDIDLEKIYGLKALPTLPVVDMVVKETSVAASKE